MSGKGQSGAYLLASIVIGVIAVTDFQSDIRSCSKDASNVTLRINILHVCEFVLLQVLLQVQMEDHHIHPCDIVWPLCEICMPAPAPATSAMLSN